MPNKNEQKDTGSMEQVRELLFGTQMKDFENLLKRSEDIYNRELTDLKNDLKSRHEILEKFAQNETAALLQRIEEEAKANAAAFREEQTKRQEELEAEHRERLDGLSRLAKDLSLAEERLNERIVSISTKLDTAEQEIRKFMLQESGSTNNLIETKYQNTLSVLKETVKQLRHELVHKSALSSLFVETAMKITETTEEGKQGKKNA